jgi:formylglycine-generating enzyme required for sulfatase activity
VWGCGSLLPNDLGLFDMLGNEYEWVQDALNREMWLRQGRFMDGIYVHQYIKEKIPRILRGGAFGDLPAFVRSADRIWLAPALSVGSYGFRPSRTYP